MVDTKPAPQWWRELAADLKAASECETQPLFVTLASIIDGRIYTDLPIPATVLAEAVRRWAPKGKIRKTLPKMPTWSTPIATDEAAACLARLMFRQWQFATGANVNLGGLFANTYEGSSTLCDVAEEFVNAVALLAGIGNRGVNRWQEAIYGR